MFDPLEFLDPILHTLEFVFLISSIAERFLRWMYARHEQLRNLGLLFAALIGLPLLIWRGVSLDRSSRAALMQAENAEVQAKIAANQAENASKSHLADTYTRAIEQLGAVDNKGEPNLELRLGGLYALEKIAKANADYHPQIMEVLCAYVRMHCQKFFDPEENDPENENESLRIDMQACLTIIGRREVSFDKDRLGLSGVKINRAILAEANFNQADFYNADLGGTILIKVNFSGAILFRADLSEAHLKDADLSGAYLTGTDLTGAKNLTCAQIESAIIDRETVLPDYIKVTWAEDNTYTCKMLGDSN